jgi:hypothetical protein
MNEPYNLFHLFVVPLLSTTQVGVKGVADMKGKLMGHNGLYLDTPYLFIWWGGSFDG